MNRPRIPALLATCFTLVGCSSPPVWLDTELPANPSGFGVLVMAHGGSPEWNRSVLDAVQPLRDRYPLSVAFGMADAASLQEAVADLEQEGASRIAVVRLFISGESWRERTEAILGLRDGAPPPPDRGGSAIEAGGHGHHGMEYWRIRTQSSFAISEEGLAQADEAAVILADRARSLSRDPRAESVLLLAHGPGDEDENRRWLAWIDARADAIRAALPFHEVRVQTLREDWPEKRRRAEREIRAFVSSAVEQWFVPIVIPFRVHGFGPYAEVLEGLDYTADGRGLLPHPEVTRWIERQVELLRGGPFCAPKGGEGLFRAASREAAERVR